LQNIYKKAIAIAIQGETNIKQYLTGLLNNQFNATISRKVKGIQCYGFHDSDGKTLNLKK
jgi:hypothetical protein